MLKSYPKNNAQIFDKSSHVSFTRKPAYAGTIATFFYTKELCGNSFMFSSGKKADEMHVENVAVEKDPASETVVKKEFIKTSFCGCAGGVGDLYKNQSKRGIINRVRNQRYTIPSPEWCS